MVKTSLKNPKALTELIKTRIKAAISCDLGPLTILIRFLRATVRLKRVPKRLSAEQGVPT